MVVEEILVEIADVEGIMTEKAATGIVQSAIIPILPSERSVTAVKRTDLEMEVGNSKEISNEVVITSKRDKIGLVLSAVTLTSPSEINAIAVKQVDLVPVARPSREEEAMNAVVLDPKGGIPDVEEEDHRVAQVNHEDLDSEELVEAALGVIDQEEVVVGAEFGAPQHSFCLNPSNTYGEQGGYALGRCSRA